ncbi:MAG: disulfide bond formation protein B [Lachnospiraceae bacterium]|nr:disulfide bond formation protein B [Lachnospiraceae bacterium]
MSPRVLLNLVLLMATARALGNALNRHFPSQPFPHPCPNLCLQKTWFGILGTVALPALATDDAIRLHLLGQGDWSFAGIGLAIVLADLAVAMAKRHHGFHYSSEAVQLSCGTGSRCVQVLNRLTGDERGMLDRFAPLILSAVLLFCLNL